MSDKLFVEITEASQIAQKVSQFGIYELWEFVDTLQKLEELTNVSGQGNFNYSGIKQRIAFNDFKENGEVL